MEHLFVRVIGGSPQFWLTGGDVLNEQQRSRDAVRFNKNASRFARGGFISHWRGQKSTIFVSHKKSRRCLPGGGDAGFSIFPPFVASGTKNTVCTFI